MVSVDPLIQKFLESDRVAFVGVSSRPRDFTRSVMRAFLARGYDVVPVHPLAADIEGRPCFQTVRAIPGGVRAALLFTPPAATARVVQDCAEAGVAFVWMHRGGGTGAVDAGAVQWARAHGLSVIAGACPLMFLPQTGWVHRLHGWFARERTMRRACTVGDTSPRALPPAH